MIDLTHELKKYYKVIFFRMFCMLMSIISILVFLPILIYLINNNIFVDKKANLILSVFALSFIVISLISISLLITPIFYRRFRKNIEMLLQRELLDDDIAYKIADIDGDYVRMAMIKYTEEAPESDYKNNLAAILRNVDGFRVSLPMNIGKMICSVHKLRKLIKEIKSS